MFTMIILFFFLVSITLVFTVYCVFNVMYLFMKYVQKQKNTNDSVTVRPLVDLMKTSECSCMNNIFKFHIQQFICA